MNKTLDNLIDEKFGHWTVIEYKGKNKHNKHIYLCRCDCEKQTERCIAKTELINGKSKSCGCTRGQNFVKDLVGKRFGKLIVKERIGYLLGENYKKITWSCDCDCGNKNILITGDCLRNGHTKSCGCINKNTYDLTGGYGIGYTSKGEKFYFDLEDYNKIKEFGWYKKNDEYIEATIKDNKTVSLHRIVMNAKDDDVIDHINHNNYDNRKKNLRKCNVSKNQMNKKIQNNNTSGITGVRWNKSRDNWIAQISINKKKICKYFKTFEEAVNCRKQLEEYYFGEFKYDKNNDVRFMKEDENEI